MLKDGNPGAFTDKIEKRTAACMTAVVDDNHRFNRRIVERIYQVDQLLVWIVCRYKHAILAGRPVLHVTFAFDSEGVLQNFFYSEPIEPDNRKTVGIESPERITALFSQNQAVFIG